MESSIREQHLIYVYYIAPSSLLLLFLDIIIENMQKSDCKKNISKSSPR
jgi:hypothetical protein